MRLLGCRKKTQQKTETFSLHLTSVCVKVSWKASTERHTSAFNGDLLHHTGTYTSLKMHSWLCESPGGCRNFLCWPLSRSLSVVGLNETTADKNKNVPWKPISLDSESLLRLLVSLGQVTFKPHARKKLGL